MTEELMQKYIEALFEEKEAFYLYKHIHKMESSPNRATVLAIMEDEMHHYEKVRSLLFGSMSIKTPFEDVFKSMVEEDLGRMKSCLEQAKMMK